MHAYIYINGEEGDQWLCSVADKFSVDSYGSSLVGQSEVANFNTTIICYLKCFLITIILSFISELIYQIKKYLCSNCIGFLFEMITFLSQYIIQPISTNRVVECSVFFNMA